MADFLNPATAPIPPAAQAIEDRHYAEPRRRMKAKPRVRQIEEPVPELPEPEEGETKHALDLDA